MNETSNIRWDRRGPILCIAATRSLAAALALVDRKAAHWIVVVRAAPLWPRPNYYALRSDELHALAQRHPERGGWTIERAASLHEDSASGVFRRGRGRLGAPTRPDPSAVRVIDFDAAGEAIAIGERTDLIRDPGTTRAAAPASRSRGPSAAPPSSQAPVESMLGSMRGRGTRSASPQPAARRAARSAAAPETTGAEPPQSGAAPASIDITLSGETKGEIQVGGTELVEFRVELSAEAAPLAVAATARARADLPLVVTLSIENDAIVSLKGSEQTVDPPAPAKPRSGFFVIKAVRAGAVRLALAFRQGGSDLGIISLTVDVVEDTARAMPAQAAAPAAPRDLADDDMLALLIEQRSDNGQVFYEYILHSEALGLPYRRLRSKPLLDRGGGIADSTLAYVDRIYERVTKELKSWDDLKRLQREARALGVSLCDELLDPDVARLLWPLRDRLKVVQIVSWEPYIPWELVRLRDPDSGDVDERFLAQYGLVRMLSDTMPPRELALKSWNYLGATFPRGSFPSVGAELGYFTGAGAQTLHGHGIEPAAVAATRDAFYDLLADGAFDVLHISCHAESPQRSIERASLIIGDETASGAAQPQLIEVDTLTVAAEARLKARRPLVFLNACETGRAGAVLTAWGGWPNVFLRAGAGAFVGASWAVRDKPAAAFATAFYDRLLDGGTLADAATAAREAALALGDASWLAYKVYGHPRARRVSN